MRGREDEEMGRKDENRGREDEAVKDFKISNTSNL
jgi:hypothetical protein